jgi:serine/threonine-protein kinase
MTRTPSPPAPARVGRYELLGEVGKGSNSSVHRARDLDTGRVVAVKLLNPELADDLKAFRRFEQEFLAARRLNHPHIVRALAFGQEGEVPSLVMEFVSGENLWARVNRDGPLDQDDSFGIIAQVAQALQHAHEQGLVHRDVKPGNILLAGEVAKLSDFGLVKDLTAASTLTQTATSLGTPNYMAPEQLEDAKRVDHRCDIYSLAATLYLTITGRVPFAVSGTRGTLRRKLGGELVPPRQLADWLSAQSEWAIMRALSVSPALRPDSCAEFMVNLTGDGFGEAAGQPAGAAGPAPPYPGRDRRASPRYACGLWGVCRPLESRGREGWPVEIRDISAEGVGLLLSRRFERGTTLLIEVRTRRPELTRTLLARVLHVAPDARHGWAVGCRLAQGLSAQELKDLYGSEPVA